MLLNLYISASVVNNSNGEGDMYERDRIYVESKKCEQGFSYETSCKASLGRQRICGRRIKFDLTIRAE